MFTDEPTISRTSATRATWSSTHWGVSIGHAGPSTVSFTAPKSSATRLCAVAASASGVSPWQWAYIRALSRTWPPRSS